MRYCAVDKKVAGIIRWLERMKKSYSDGAIENALMDAECARADLENLRNDVWQKVRPSKHNEHKTFHVLTSVLKCVSLAAIVILFHVAPMAKDNVPPQSVKEEMKALTQTQPKPIIVVREYEKEEKPDAKAKDSANDSKGVRNMSEKFFNKE